MIYQIRLAGAEQDDGKIDLQRLIELAQSVTDIAKGALQIRLLGVSSKGGKKTERMKQALSIKLSDLKKGSTVLELECEPFTETLMGTTGRCLSCRNSRRVASTNAYSVSYRVVQGSTKL